MKKNKAKERLEKLKNEVAEEIGIAGQKAKAALKEKNINKS
ncbi:MAG: small, acid-soluble spore protein, alpha/beta type [Syntrophomonadaceae bacterium]|jgi:hypothetical protein|nr:small, acid-soluble spore protein, alpha/beta type [Syntrophomonadaceae bacterium]